MTTRQLLQISELAEQLGVAERFIRRPVSERRILYLKTGKFIRFDPEAIDTWTKEQRVPAD